MRVLITRPESRAHVTASKLSALGHEPVSFPLFAPVHDLAAAACALEQPHSAIAVSSPEAVRVLAELGEELAPHLATRLFAVGKSTGRAAEETGFSDVEISSGSGQELGNAVATYVLRARGQSLPVLYLAGEKRMGRFEKVLSENGIAFDLAETYRMEPVSHPLEEQQALLVQQPVDAVFLYSRETARAFFALDVFGEGHDALRKTIFLCLSRNIAEAVPDELQDSAVVSLNPDEDELIDLL